LLLGWTNLLSLRTDQVKKRKKKKWQSYQSTTFSVGIITGLVFGMSRGGLGLEGVMGEKGVDALIGVDLWGGP
jgi:hypothetical protein